MSSPIKNVTLVGATGNVGAVALEKLAASSFDLQVLRRPGSKSALPPAIKVVDVDFDSVSALTAALRGQDAVVCTLGAAAVPLQRNIIDAAAAAGVRRFVPSEFGSDSSNPHVRQIPVFADKIKIQDYLQEKAQQAGGSGGALSYTFVYTGPFLDWGIEHNFILSAAGYKATVVDDGTQVFSSTTLDTVGRALVAVLEHADETKNRAVFLEDLKVSQGLLLELAKKASPGKSWEVSHVRLDDIVKKAGEQLAQGNISPESITPFLYKSFLTEGYGGSFEKPDNELLGLGKSSEEFVLQLYKKILQ